MSRVLVGLCFALTLVLVPAASAKGPFQVCGASGCAVLGDEAAQPPVRLFGMAGGTAPIAPPAPAPYFVIRFADVGDTLAYWVPSSSALRIVPQNGPGSWIPTLAGEETLLRDKTAGLRPFAPPAHANAYVDWQPVKHAGRTYLRLFGLGTPTAVVPRVRWLEIWIRGPASPWTDYSVLFWVSRTGSFLKRDDGVVLTIPKQVADRIRRRLPLG